MKRVSILSSIQNKFIKILAFILFIGLISNIFQLFLLENETNNNMQEQIQLIAHKIKESVTDKKLLFDSIEHQIDLRLVGYAKNIADLLGDKSLDEITNTELEAIRQHLGISGISLFAKQGDAIVVQKSSDPEEIGFGFKEEQTPVYKLIHSVLNGSPLELVPVSYIDDRAIVTNVTKSGSQPDTNQYFKYAHYHTPGTSYIISCFIEANDVFQHASSLGPNRLIKRLKEENPYIEEISVLMPRSLEKPQLEEGFYPSYRSLLYGSYPGVIDQEIEMLSHFDRSNPTYYFTTSEDGRRLYKTFLPIDEGTVVYIALDYEKVKSSIDRRLFITIILAILCFTIFILLVKKISQRSKETEAELWKSKQMLSSIIDHSPLGIIVFDKDHRVVLWNPLAEKIYGQSSLTKEAGFFNPHSQNRWIPLLVDTEQGKPNTFEFNFQNEEGSTVMISCSTAPLLDSGHHSIGYITIHKDITLEKQMEEKLQYTGKLSIVSQLSASIAHEIRNPLTSIKGFVQLMKEANDQNSFYLDIMETELNRINEIVSEFMSLAKPQAIKFQVLDLREIIKQTLPLFESIANLNNITIATNISPELLTMNGNEHQIKQVFINIIKNSIEAMPSNGHLEITANRIKDGKLSVTFSDNGPGIPEERLAKIGEPFYTTKEKGSGLGLMICYKIIHSHEGDIHISSTVGMGTTVEIVLRAIE